MDDRFDQCVIGAGIIGLSIAYSLTRAGQKVVVVDPDGMANGASSGNAGAFAFADVEPLASLGTLLRSPRWLLDPLGPLSLPLSHALPMLPWMTGFARACVPDTHAASTKAQAALMRLAKEHTESFFQKAGLGDHIRREGALYLYEGEKAFNAAAEVWKVRADHGVGFEPVTGERLATLQPGLGPSYTHAMFVPDWLMVTDPHDLTKALGERTVALGAKFHQIGADDITLDDEGGIAQLSDGDSVKAQKAVVAAGAWSGKLAARLGDKVPIQPERGYNTTLPKSAFDLKRQLVLPGDGYVITPLASGIRVGGAAEFAGFKRKPDFRRSAAMLKKSEKVMSGLKTEGGEVWMGIRPSLPDTLPVIGPASKDNRVIYALGHGHLGLTQCVATAMTVRDLALGNPPPIDIHPYRVERF
ncbi:MAG: NAD(P)/FAD-dependent oxidoreductase [Cohaesibacteraceae bacterium]